MRAKFESIFLYNPECPHGTFDENCSKDCPPGNYGLLCKGICNCDAKTCDKAHGCSKKGKYNFQMKFFLQYYLIKVCQNQFVFNPIATFANY